MLKENESKIQQAKTLWDEVKELIEKSGADTGSATMKHFILMQIYHKLNKTQESK